MLLGKLYIERLWFGYYYDFRSRFCWKWLEIECLEWRKLRCRTFNYVNKINEMCIVIKLISKEANNKKNEILANIHLRPFDDYVDKINLSMLPTVVLFIQWEHGFSHRWNAWAIWHWLGFINICILNRICLNGNMMVKPNFAIRLANSKSHIRQRTMMMVMSMAIFSHLATDSLEMINTE